MNKTQLNRIATARERAVLQAFIMVVQSIRDQTVIQEVVFALEQRNVERALDLLQLDRATYDPLIEEIVQSYRQGGLTAAQQIGQIPMQDATIAARFDARSEAAQAWAASLSSRMVVEIIDQQRETLRGVITQGLADGRNPRSVALDIVGRVNDRGVREGGFIGLTSNQAQWVVNARQELSLNPRLVERKKSELLALAKWQEASPADLDYRARQMVLEGYLNRQLRDKRFDRTVRKAIESGEPLKAAQIDNAITRMQARAEKYRGDVIARTESINALREGQQQCIRDAFEQSDIEQKEVIREWDASGDSSTRPTHADADGQTVNGMDQPFLVGGYRLMYPGDSSLGAPARETIQCRCTVRTRIDWGGRLKRIEGFG